MGGSYEEQGSAEDSVNVNPLTGDVTSMLEGQLSAGTMGAEQLIQQLMSGEGAFNFLDILGDKRLEGIIGNFADQRNTLAEQAAGNAQRQISGDYAGTGIYSGAFGEAVGKGVGEAYQGAAVDIAGKQLGMYGQAVGAAAGLQGQNTGSMMNYYGQQAGGAMAGLTGLGAPNFYSPTYAYEKGPFDYLLDAASVGASVYGMSKIFG